MIRTYNYKYLRQHFRPKMVNTLPSEGKWVTVSVAASILNRSKQSIRLMYLRGDLPSIKFKRSPILVDVSRINH